MGQGAYEGFRALGPIRVQGSFGIVGLGLAADGLQVLGFGCRVEWGRQRQRVGVWGFGAQAGAQSLD